MGLASGMWLISCLEAEIHAIEVMQPSSYIFPLAVGLYSIRTSFNGLLDPQNIAVIILLFSCLEVEIQRISS